MANSECDTSAWAFAKTSHSPAVLSAEAVTMRLPSELIDALALAFAIVAMGIPAIIMAAALGSRLGFYW
jgi:hypothetical protein